MRWNQRTIVLAIAAALVLVVVVVASTRAFDFTGSSVYPIQVNKKFGFIDRTKQLVVEAVSVEAVGGGAKFRERKHKTTRTKLPSPARTGE